LRVTCRNHARRRLRSAIGKNRHPVSLLAGVIYIGIPSLLRSGNDINERRLFSGPLEVGADLLYFLGVGETSTSIKWIGVPAEIVEVNWPA
jgi:hypothetical protein